MQEKMVLIDGHSILNRAFYGVPDLTNSKGVHTGAVYGFLNIMFQILREEEPGYLMVAFDEHAPTFRHEMFEAYKGTRKPMPEELRAQVPLMKQMLQAMGVTIYSHPGWEADDILGTMAKNAEKDGLEVSLISGDRDLLQIASDHIRIRIPKTKKGGTEIENYYAADVQKAYQMSPAQFIELKALMGDTADNIPGVPKVGEKTATELMVTYGSIENIYAHLEEIKKNAIRESLRENRELADLSLRLATIKTDCALGIEPREAVYGDLYTPEAYELCRELELKSLLSRFGEKAVRGTAREAEKCVGKITDIPVLKKTLEKAGKDTVLTFVLTPVVQSYGEYFFSLYQNEGEAQIFYISEKELPGVRKALRGALEKGTAFHTYEIGSFYPLVFGFVAAMVEDGYGEERLSSEVCATLEDGRLMAYLLNPLKSNIPLWDAAGQFGSGAIPSYEEVFGKRKLLEVFDQEPQALADHLAAEVCVLPGLLSNMREALTEQGMMKLYREVEMPLSYVLYRMEKEGILADADALRAYGESLSGKIRELESAIYEAAGEEFNINSPKQLAVILFEKMGLPGGKKTKTGYSTSAEVLEKLAGEYPFVRTILEYRTYAKLKSTYADSLADYVAADGRIHTKYQQTVTATGRLSSTEPNLQNIPMRTELGRQIRKVFTPKPGCVFADADYSQIELRILASLAGDAELIEAYKGGKDIHRITASKVFHVPFEEVTDLQRRNAKAVNFGIVYGISTFGLSQDLSISQKEAKNYIEEYFKTYPGIRSFLEKAKEDAKKTGYSLTLFGRRRPIPELKSSNFMQRQFGERVAMNAPIQGTAADIMKIAMLRVYDRILREGLQARVLLQIHDELLIETPENEQDRILAILREEMGKAADLAVELEVDAHIGRDWYEAK